jgi:putative ABC transport system permease protein
MKQIFNELKQQPLVSAITAIGTALSIFLIMVVVMLQQVKVADFAPESNRSRMLHYKMGSITHVNWGDANSNGPLSDATIKELLRDLSSAETTTAYKAFYSINSAALPGETPVSVKLKPTDAEFFKVFDFTFISGAPFNRADFEAGRPQIVLSEDMTRKVFKSTDVIGREMLIDMAPFTVVGVVKDVSKLASTAYAEAWIPYTTAGLDREEWNDGHMGLLSATILARSSDDFQSIHDEIDARLARINTAMKEAEGYEFIGRNRPYTQEKQSIGLYANIEPDLDKARRTNLIIYAILLLVPAINLSSMTRSRMRRRTAEIGVRRAFGATAGRITLSLILENLVITLIAGAAGLVMCVLFAWLGGSYLFSTSDTRISAEMLLQWSTFAYALLFCFILNLLCSAIPAWRSARVGIVDSLSGINR